MNRFGSSSRILASALFLILSAFTGFCEHAQAQLSCQPSNYWHLDETSGTRLPAGGSVNLNDTNNNVGYATGTFGNAAAFTAKTNELLQPGSTLNFANGGQWSISFWAYLNSVTNNYGFFGHNYGGSGGASFLQVWSGHPDLRNEASTDITYSTLTFGSGIWSHVVVTADAASPRNVAVYLNGVKETHTWTNDALAIAVFGKMSTTSSWASMSGRMDEIAVFPCTLSQADVNTLYNGGAGYLIPLAISTASLPGGAVTVPYNQTLSASGGTAPYSWSIVSGALPDGLSLNASTGAITGTPTVPNTFNFTVRVTDSVSATADKGLSIVVGNPPQLSCQPSNYWRLDETGGTRLPVIGNVNLNDTNNNIGYAAGKFGNAAAFTAKTNELLQPGSTLTFADGGQWSISFWTYLNSLTNNSGFFGHNYGVSGGASYLQIWSGHPDLRNEASSDITYSALTFGSGSWSHVVVTADNASPRNVAVYLNGTKETHTWTNDALAITVFGKMATTPNWTNWNSMNGRMDEIAVFACTLSQADVGTLYNGGLGYPIPIVFAISTASLPGGTVTAPYNQALSASGGTAPYTWSTVSGALPDGLSLNASTGAISGTPTVASTFNFTVRVTDSTLATADKALSIVIANPPQLSCQPSNYWRLDETSGTRLPVIGNINLNDTNNNIGYAAGMFGNAAAFTVKTNELLQPGSALNFADGWPWSISFWAYLNSVTNNYGFFGHNGVSGAASYLQIWSGSPDLHNEASSDVTYSTLALGLGWSHVVVTADGASPRNVAVYLNGTKETHTWTNDALAITVFGKMSATSGSSSMSGRMDEIAVFPCTLSQADVNTLYNGSTGQPIGSSANPLAINTASFSVGTVGAAYNQTLVATGGMPPYNWSIITGALPAGLSLNAVTGVVSGTPSAAGTSSFTVQVADANSSTATRNLSLTVNAAVSITTSSLPDVIEATNYSVTVTAAGGTPPLTWSIAQGALPDGMSLNSNSGVISGMSLTLGTSNFTVAVTDRNGSTANQALSIAVVPMVAHLTDSLGHQSSYTSAVSGGMWYVTDSSGSGCSSCTLRGETHSTIDANGNVLSTTDALGHQTAYTYDSNNNLASSTVYLNGAAVTTSYTYNSFGEVLTVTDALNHVTTNTYDTKGNLKTVTTPAPDGQTVASVTQFDYDTKGELTQITDPLNHITAITYTSAGLIQSIALDPGGQNLTTNYEYDPRGNRTAIVDANQKRTEFDYDLMNRLTAIRYPDNNNKSVIFGYDSRGRRTSVTDQNNRTTTYAYDDADRLTSVTDAANHVTQYGYDTENNLISITDAATHPATTFQYDAYGRVTQTTFPSTLFETYGYDAVGNLTSKTDRKNQTIQYVYDALNRLTHKGYPDSTSVDYVYDLVGKIQQVNDPSGTYTFAYDNMGRLIGTTTQYSFLTGQQFTTSYGYDAASNRTSFTSPDNTTVGYVYDTVNRLQTLTSSFAGQFGFGYDALSRRTSLTRPNGVSTSYTYDSMSRLLSVLHQAGGVTIDGASYALDDAGNRTTKQNLLSGVTDNYTYDLIYQLTQVVQGANTTEGYSYDAVGNRLSSLGLSPYQYNNSNELTSTPNATFTYDNNGNTLTKTDSNGVTGYSWDYENRVTSVTLPGTGGTVNFKYDPFGRRIQKSGPAGTTIYLYDGANVVTDLNAAGAVVASYAQGSGIDEPLASLTAAGTAFFEADGLGSVTSLSGMGGITDTYTYNAFGVTTATGSNPNRFRYTGREWDSDSGLYYYRARYYDPAAGHFISEDPMRFGGGISFYRYVGNGPTTFLDPSGLTMCMKTPTAGLVCWDDHKPGTTTITPSDPGNWVPPPGLGPPRPKPVPMPPHFCEPGTDCHDTITPGLPKSTAGGSLVFDPCRGWDFSDEEPLPYVGPTFSCSGKLDPCRDAERKFTDACEKAGCKGRTYNTLYMGGVSAACCQKK